MGKTHQVLIIGGGAAGLLAALAAGYQGVPAIILEKGPSCGKKLGITGGGRGNLTNLALQNGWQAQTPQDPFCAQEQAEKILRPLHQALPPAAIRKLFADLGVPTYADEEGRVYPKSNQAQDLTDALVRGVLKTGGQIITQTPVVNLLRGEDWQVVTEKELYHTKNLVITCGGASYPQTGSSGDGNRLFANLDVAVRPFSPALTALLVEEAFPAELAGITLPEVRLSYLLRGKHKNSQRERQGSLLFQRKGLSGPVVINSSADLYDRERYVEGSLKLNLIPSLDPQDYAHALEEYAKAYPKRHVSRFLETLLPARLADQLWKILCQACKFREETQMANLSKPMKQALTEKLFAYKLTPSTPPPLRVAMAARGGLATKEVNFRTMELTRYKGLFAAGECLDLDFKTGGYHLTFAFQSGFLAGTEAARRVKEERSI